MRFLSAYKLAWYAILVNELMNVFIVCFFSLLSLGIKVMLTV